MRIVLPAEFRSPEKSPARCARVGTVSSGVTLDTCCVRSHETKKCVWLADRTANRKAILIQPERRTFRREEVPRIQGAVSQKLENAAVEIIGAGSCRQTDNAACRVAILG